MNKILILFLIFTIYSSAQNKNELYIFEKESTFGAVNNQFKVVIKPIFQKLKIHEEHPYLISKLKGKYGILDINGNEILSNNYEYLEFSSVATLFKFKENNKFGLIDLKGQKIINPKYNEIIVTHKGKILIIQKNGNYGMISSKGDKITDFKYKSIINYFNSDLFAFKNSDNKYGYLDKKGKEVIKANFDFANQFINDFAVIIKDRKKGIINKKGEIIIDPIYNDIHLYSPFTFTDVTESSFTFLDSEESFFYTEKDGKYGLLDNQLKTILQPTYDKIGAFTEGVALVSNNNKYGFIDKKGKIVIPIIYDKASYFSEGLAPVNKDRKWGFINKNNETIIDFKFSGHVNPFYEGLARYCEYCQKCYSDQYYSVKNCGFINKKGEIIIKPIYKSAKNFKNGISIVDNSKNLLLINKKNKSFNLKENDTGLSEIEEY
ncbi:WG repeat-containing protein [Tenacibaculum caenipelagi]|uniref:WG repeat protein n=1 Tax=Tenacibaculum caenipelagi TaxID=1325435 RepID=A0A4R6TBX7_9FLAO|nr:WG repeat-containing protein [Tenacibaculum caenipelagi]TDQ25483.1 WG repeat protein [Tenacibaculum caenipelagi]